jgi:hypothetical protein
MNIPEKYKESILVNTEIFNTRVPPKKKLVSCGILNKNNKSQLFQSLQLDYYSGVYILNGTGKYIDCSTSESYFLYPGCFIQRLPGKHFETIIDEKSNWIEFFININEQLFNTLVNLEIFSKEPVLCMYLA